jgi:hypothetical protein
MAESVTVNFISNKRPIGNTEYSLWVSGQLTFFNYALVRPKGRRHDNGWNLFIHYTVHTFEISLKSRHFNNI